MNEAHVRTPRNQEPIIDGGHAIISDIVQRKSIVVHPGEEETQESKNIQYKVQSPSKEVLRVSG